MCLFALLFVVLSTFLPAQSATKKQNGQKEVEKPAVNQSVSDTTESAIIPVSEPPTETRDEHDGENRPLNINDTLVVVFTGLLVLVGGLQWWTLREHKKEFSELATAATTNADAAIKSVEAFKNSQRAWVVVHALRGKDRAGENLREKFKASVRNAGKTPARVVKTFLWFGFVNSPTQLATEPKLEMWVDRNNLLLVPGDSFPLEGRPNDLSPGSLPYAYGAVIYLDVNGVEHETWFGLCSQLGAEGDFVADGHPRYNRAT